MTIQYDEIQQKAINLPVELRKSGKSRIGIICGGPGTGKSSVIAEMIKNISNNSATACIKLAAPTGKAANVINGMISAFGGNSKVSQAVTIHRLLGCRGLTWEYHPGNKLNCTHLIIDEASMIDSMLFWRIISATTDNCIIIILGDKDQLQPVGAGSPFLDLIEAGNKEFLVELKTNYRQLGGSMLAQSVINISRGIMPVFGLAGKDSLKRGMEDDCFWTEQSDRGRIAMSIIDIIAPWHQSGDDYLCVVPQKIGPIGLVSLNPVLQEELNPGNDSGINIFGQLVKEKDIVRQTKNNYKLGKAGVFNGYIGKVKYADKSEIAVEYPGYPSPETVLYTDPEDWKDLVLAYAVTGHSSQGSQADKVCCLCHGSNWNMLTNSWIYVGLSRAQKICHCVGETEALKHAVGNRKSTKRNTFLGLALKKRQCWK